MLSNYKSATLWAVIFWALIFAGISVLMFTPALAGKQGTQGALEVLVLVPAVILFSSHMYLKGVKNPTVIEGLMLGAYFVIIATVLDILITIPLFVKSYSALYGNWAVWVGFFETVLFSAAAGYYLEKKK